MIAFFRRASNGLDGRAGISIAGTRFPHRGQSPYGAALLSHTEKKHQDGLEKSSLSLSLSNFIIIVPAGKECHFLKKLLLLLLLLQL